MTRIGRKPLLVTGIATTAGLLAFGLVNGPCVRAQSPTLDWQTAAGGKMSFDVASVKQNKSAEPSHTSISLDAGDAYSPNGGLFTATDIVLGAYIRFAYKVPPDQYRRLDSQLPKWAITEEFDIQARAKGNPSKDQMRLMMQSLLADRFNLRVHTERRQLPVFVLVLEKAGKTGSQLQPHPSTILCADPASASGPSGWSLDASAPNCGVLLASRVAASSQVRYGMRRVSMDLIASSLGELSGLGRPVLNQAGLTGDYDFTIQWDGVAGPTADVQSDTSGPTFQEALQDQLGLKLDPNTGSADVFVIDHIEEPSEN